MEDLVALALVMEVARRVACVLEYLHVSKWPSGYMGSLERNNMLLTFRQTRCSRPLIAFLEKIGRSTSRRSFA